MLFGFVVLAKIKMHHGDGVGQHDILARHMANRTDQFPRPVRVPQNETVHVRHQCQCQRIVAIELQRSLRQLLCNLDLLARARRVLHEVVLVMRKRQARLPGPGRQQIYALRLTEYAERLRGCAEEIGQVEELMALAGQPGRAPGRELWLMRELTRAVARVAERPVRNRG